MGRGSYTAADWNKLRNSRNLNNAASETEIFRKTSCDQRFDPKFIQTREARDSDDHPESLPIILGLDVTGSMGYLAKKVAQESLNETMMKLYSTNAVKDPALMFAAYGDIDDASPLQVTQFESDIRIAEQLLDLWLENRGSGKVCPSLLWYFAAKHTSLDNFEKRKKKGFHSLPSADLTDVIRSFIAGCIVFSSFSLYIILHRLLLKSFRNTFPAIPPSYVSTDFASSKHTAPSIRMIARP